MISPTLLEMEVGQKGFLDAKAIRIINNKELFICKTGNVSDEEILNLDFIIPIERIGERESDFIIDINVNYFFFNEKRNEKEKKQIYGNGNFIGPFQVLTERYQPKDYRTQQYPRMGINELIEAFIGTNILLDETESPNKTFLEDKKALKKLIKKKLSKINDVETLKVYEEMFSSNSDTDEEDERKYIVSENIVNHIRHCIANLTAQSGFDNMSVQELEDAKKTALNENRYEDAAVIRDIINKKTGKLN